MPAVERWTNAGSMQSAIAWLRARPALLSAFAVLALFGAYSTLVHDIVQNGDAAVYNEQVEQHIFGERPIHVGYMLCGALFHALLPCGVDRAMNLMALSFGIAGVAATYSTAARWGSWRTGASAVLFLLCSATYVRAMVMSEVDILSASLVAISFAAYVRGNVVVAGLIFGAAMLATPVTLGVIPLFVFTFAISERGIPATIGQQAWRVLRFGLAGLALYAPWVVTHFHDYFWGSRGIFTAPASRFDAAAQLLHALRFFREDAWGLVPLYLTALVAMACDRARWLRDQPALAVLIAAITCALAVDRAGDVPVYLPLVPITAICGALFLEQLARGARVVWALPCLAFASMGLPASRAVRAEVWKNQELADTYADMRAQSLPLEPMLADLPGGFTPRRIFEHYVSGRSYNGLALSASELGRLLPALASGSKRYVIYYSRRVPANIEQALAPRYSVEIRLVNGRRYTVLDPRLVEVPASP